MKNEVLTKKLGCQKYVISGIQEFQKAGGGGRSQRGRIFRSGVCFDAPSHIPYLFVARVVNKINNVNIVY